VTELTKDGAVGSSFTDVQNGFCPRCPWYPGGQDDRLTFPFSSSPFVFALRQVGRGFSDSLPSL
jgi:hypothetical protein